MTSLSAPSVNLSSEKRFLLIDNDNYKQWHSLQYCNNNVNGLQIKLCGIHFQVIVGIDLTCEEMDTAIETFVHTICFGDLIFSPSFLVMRFIGMIRIFSYLSMITRLPRMRHFDTKQ